MISAALALSLCGLGSAAGAASPDQPISCFGVVSSEWKAVNNLMPPGPFSFHVRGKVQVANQGVIAKLGERASSNAAPGEIALEITLSQRPGAWPPRSLPVDARFDKPLGATGKYRTVAIYCDQQQIQSIDVTDAQ
jgi:hypothetical protein